MKRSNSSCVTKVATPADLGSSLGLSIPKAKTVKNIKTLEDEKASVKSLVVPVLTFMTECESSLFARLYAGHPDVIVVDEANKVWVSGADLGVHTCA